MPTYSDVHQQKQSPLNRIPKEIRDLIFQYALTDDGVPLPNCDNVFRRGLKGYIPRVDSACTLLQTCKAVYIEAYRLPMQLNGYFEYRGSYGYYWNCPSRPHFARIIPVN
ncbi:hypothetical protein P171DRAFT_428042 [Karstenula rhodostoma CBS 690.94]|uniref:F-box domain-containing protein n=1 Tax=Karstenula rhodostoma CBS 690.94 TaxID=1392251 RepID=A0A9P4UGT3_9PLEO|nr:hypothetical protein P171DRAFT_428042 [Karstenula rhodostoma CBS 690.94]